MIIAFEGDLGSGKTMCMTDLGLKRYEIEELELIANYKLIGVDYYHLDNVKQLIDLKDYKPNKRKLVLLDELWISTDARTSQSKRNIEISQSILQSRKFFSDMMYTTQRMRQVEVRITEITQLKICPQIVLVDDNNIPVIISLHSFLRGETGDFDLYNGCVDSFVYGVHKYYDTYEVIKPLSRKPQEDLIDKYMDFIGNKSELESVLTIDEEYSKSDSKLLANYIMSKQKLANLN